MTSVHELRDVAARAQSHWWSKRYTFALSIVGLSGFALLACGGTTYSRPSVESTPATSHASADDYRVPQATADPAALRDALAKQGYIFGVVYNTAGRPASGVTVQMFPDGRGGQHHFDGNHSYAEIDLGSQAQVDVTTDSQGRYAEPVCAKGCYALVGFVRNTDNRNACQILTQDVRGDGKTVGRVDWQCPV
jgi:hypothetical protein